MKILVTGDIHMGRRPAQLPSELAGDPHFSTTAAWEAVVERAVAEAVDVVALTGDVVDRENRYFEAFGPLERGLQRLAEAGIDTVAVAGNHDHEVFPRLAAQLGNERFHLLGDGEHWERQRIERPGGEVLVVEGWSFPEGRYEANPLDAYDLGPPPEDLPVVALLHADLGQSTSPYAPVSLAQLKARPVALWLLGHIHAPQLFPGDGPPVLNPGSPMALDGGETGIHGPWRVEIEGRRVHPPEQLPLSPVRYEDLPVDLSGAGDREEAMSRMVEAVRRGLEEAVARSGDALRLLLCRLRLTGSTAIHGSLPTLATEAEEQLRLTAGDASARPWRVAVETRPAVDLEELARSSTPAGALARTLLALEGGREPEAGAGGHGEPDAAADLVRRAVEQLASAHRATPYLQIGEDPAPDAVRARDHLLAAGYRLLGDLLGQQEAAG